MFETNKIIPTLGVVFICMFYTLLLVAFLQILNVYQAPVVAATVGVLSFITLRYFGKIVKNNKSEHEQKDESVLVKQSQTENPITEPIAPPKKRINQNHTTIKTLSYRNDDEENKAIEINFLVNNDSDIQSEKFFPDKRQAEHIALKLDKLHPRLTFWVEDATDIDDPFATYQMVIKAKIVQDKPLHNT